MKKFRIIILTVLVGFSAIAQNNETDLEEIQGSWKYDQGKSPKISYTFKGNICTMYFEKDTITVSEFYFSDNIDETFDKSKMGQADKGKYLVLRVINAKLGPDNPHCSALPIISINKNFLIWKSHKRKLTIKLVRAEVIEPS